jgi:competence protein ComEC
MGGIPVFSPVCNALSGLIFGSILIPLAVLIDLLVCSPWSAWKPLISLWILTVKPVLAVLERFSSYPFAFLILSEAGCMAATTASLAAIAIWRKRGFGIRTGFALFLSIVAVAGAFEWTRATLLTGGTVIHFPRVGQADAAILMNEGRTIVIDCAGQADPGRSTPVEKTLVKLGVKKIDALFLTHAHPDHTGGFKNLLHRWKIGSLYLPEIEKGPGRWSSIIDSLPVGTEVISLSKEKIVRIGSLEFLVLGPMKGWVMERGENAGSLQLFVKGDDVSALFTGDAPWEQVIVSLERVTRLDLIKIPHHGSKKGFPPEKLGSTISRLRRAGELTAVFPSPPPGRGALPAEEVVHWFERQGVRCLFSGERAGAVIKFRK